MLKTYVQKIQNFLTSLEAGIDTPPKHVVQYLRDHLVVAVAQVETSARPMVHCLKSAMHMSLLDAFFAGEVDELTQTQVESLWREAIIHADSKPTSAVAA